MAPVDNPKVKKAAMKNAKIWAHLTGGAWEVSWRTTIPLLDATLRLLHATLFHSTPPSPHPTALAIFLTAVPQLTDEEPRYSLVQEPRSGRLRSGPARPRHPSADHSCRLKGRCYGSTSEETNSLPRLRPSARRWQVDIFPPSQASWGHSGFERQGVREVVGTTIHRSLVRQLKALGAACFVVRSAWPSLSLPSSPSSPIQKHHAPYRPPAHPFTCCPLSGQGPILSTVRAGGPLIGDDRLR